MLWIILINILIAVQCRNPVIFSMNYDFRIRIQEFNEIFITWETIHLSDKDKACIYWFKKKNAFRHTNSIKATVVYRYSITRSCSVKCFNKQYIKRSRVWIEKWWVNCYIISYFTTFCSLKKQYFQFF